jgi:hypothetical protein
MRRLKQLPWIPLILIAILTCFWVFFLEFFLGIASTQLAIVQDTLKLLYSPPLGIIMNFVVAVGVGALAVYFLEVVYPRILINAATLWALVLCLVVAIFVKSVLPVLLSTSTSLIRADQTVLIGLVLGVFLKGKSYWR